MQFSTQNSVSIHPNFTEIWNSARLRSGYPQPPRPRQEQQKIFNLRKDSSIELQRLAGCDCCDRISGWLRLAWFALRAMRSRSRSRSPRYGPHLAAVRRYGHTWPWPTFSSTERRKISTATQIRRLRQRTEHIDDAMVALTIKRLTKCHDKHCGYESVTVMLNILFLMVITEMVTNTAMQYGPFKPFVNAPDSDWGESDSSPDL